MNVLLRRIVRTVTPTPIRRRARPTVRKARLVASYGGFRRSPRSAIRYILFDREFDNFTYDIANVADLAAFLASALGGDRAVHRIHLDELGRDAPLARLLRQRLSGKADRNRVMPFGRRLGWYAVARWLKPRLIVETGVHDGLGSIALLRALERNEQDGSPGELLSFEVDPSAGWLIPEALRSRHTIVVGNSLEQIPAAVSDRGVTLFIHDSDHRREHEAAEFELIAPYLVPGAAVISDNSHSTTALAEFSQRHGLRYSFWREVPVRHFYPGAGIGLGVVPGTDGMP